MRAIVAGGEGFLGSHLCNWLHVNGWDVTSVDNGSTSSAVPLLSPEVEAIRLDVCSRNEDFRQLALGRVDWIFNLASPASPPAYLAEPIRTLRTGSIGTLNLLDLALRTGASFFQASTSEVYGDPLVHPQTEDYWGNVNPIGPRSVYDEAKRFGEAACYAYAEREGLDVRVARIFNTYGPGMRADDGRAVPQFITQAIYGEPITVHGDGSQTRSLCYVDDLIDGIMAMVGGTRFVGPVNLGNPYELTVLQLAELVKRVTESESQIVFTGRPIDDPERRCPDITLIRVALGWEPRVLPTEGLRRTAAWMRAVAPVERTLAEVEKGSV